MAKVGYIRVSSVDQNTARQLDGIELDQIYTDKASGKSTKRPQLQECLRYLRDGDELHVHSIDRLARSLLDLQQMMDKLTQAGITITFHKESMTFSKDQDKPMHKLLLQILGAFAEFERSLIRERQAEGIAAAQAAGKHLGRSRKLSDYQVAQIKARQNENKTALAKEFGCSRQTIYSALAS